LARGGGGAAVAGGGTAGVRLLDDGERERRRETPQRLDRSVDGAVDDDDYLKRRRILLRRKRPHRGDDDVSALVGRDDDAEAEGRLRARLGLSGVDGHVLGPDYSSSTGRLQRWRRTMSPPVRRAIGLPSSVPCSTS